ncbi:MAG TPA: hypothetical protein PKD49_08425 [Hyphomicrobium sp.]|nr:hypothetical protein [Hyphomicrobium sp.]
MDALERDYPTVLLAGHEPPCVSLYQPTHRSYPDRQQDPIRFRNLVKAIESSLKQKYAAREISSLLKPFHDLAADPAFWNRALDGLAMFVAPDMLKIYRLQRPVRALTVVADSFHTKPLMRILQSADRYHILGLNRRNMRLFEANRYAVDEIEPAPEVPRSVADVVEEKSGEPERKRRVYGAGPGGTTSHGTDVRQDEIESETERFFRAVDRAVLDYHSRPSGLPLLLAALPEHHHLFRSVSRNPFLVAQAIDVDAGAVSNDDFRERAWQIMLPFYLERLNSLIERFGVARTQGLAATDTADIAKAAAAGRISTLLIEADREVPGHFDPASGAIEFAPLDHPRVDDLLDDLGEHALRTGGEVVIVPAGRMPTGTGIAAIYRF